MTWKVRALIAIGFGVVSSLACADAARITYYDIFGSTPAELRRELDTKGPVDKFGVRGHGLTNWFVAWNFHYVPAAGGCRFSEIVVTVTGEMVMPRWQAGERGSNALARKWQAYLPALRLHEDGHYAHGIRAAEEIEALGRGFYLAESCSRIGQVFNDRAHAILDKYRTADINYDADNGHGRTQGAVFP
jgi:predicted secreted Zn-dependent protease